LASVAVLPATWTGKGRILLVDDELAVRESMARLVVGLGFECVQAASGREALALYHARDRYDLIVLDLIMPECSGEEVMKAILDTDPTQRILLVSGFNLRDRDTSLPKSETVAFLQKPFDLVSLRSAVRTVLKF
jgi:two-component system cell cycle sensor histidine kinase/response regulator CckA